MNRPDQETPPRRRRAVWIGAALVGATLAVGGALWAGETTTNRSTLPDLLGKAQPPLREGMLQVQDLAADPKGYKGTIGVRGVVAMVAPNDPQFVALIDSREARICKDLNCANFYLPTKVKQAGLKPWDEVNLTGTIAADPTAQKKVVFMADAVENLGSIKK